MTTEPTRPEGEVLAFGTDEDGYLLTCVVCGAWMAEDDEYPDPPIICEWCVEQGAPVVAYVRTLQAQLAAERKLLRDVAKAWQPGSWGDITDRYGSLNAIREYVIALLDAPVVAS